MGIPDLFDGGEQERSFKPQMVVAGKANQTFEVNFEVVNGGTGSPNEATTAEVYASTDPWISRSDYLLGTAKYFFISNAGSLKVSLKVVFPTNIPASLYYIGWIIDPADLVPDELDETNNMAYLESYRLLVSSPAGTKSLTLSAALGGQIVTPGEGVFTYSTSKVVSVQASADPNCFFAGWTGTAVDAGKVLNPGASSTQVTVDAQYALKAVFGGPHLIVDDFESYGDPCNPIQSVWIDGLGWKLGNPQGHRGNETGATVGLAEQLTPANPTVHGGSLSMFLDYNNRKSPYYSEISRRWPELQNWAATGADKLSIWFRGLPGNATQPLFVIVEDCYGKSAVIGHPDMQASRRTGWTQWTIPLQQVQATGVMLSRIVKLYIRVGEKDNPFGAGTGTLYFDDIALVHE